MYLISYLQNATVFLMCLAGLCLFTVRRERSQIKFYLCIFVALILQYVIYFFTVTGDIEIQGTPISKILTILMMSILVFWGGLYVYGGWTRVGIYIFCADLILGTVNRLFLAAWEYFTHRSVEQSIIYKGNTVVLMYLLKGIISRSKG